MLDTWLCRWGIFRNGIKNFPTYRPSVWYYYGAPNKYPTLGPVNGQSIETESRNLTYKAKCRVFITML